MIQKPKSHLFTTTIRGTTVFAASLLALGQLATPAWAEAQKEQKEELRHDAKEMLKGNRSVLGKVEAITSDQIKLDIGEMQPRFLPLKQARQKGFETIKEGDELIVVLNAENLLVDYHPVDGESSSHTVIRGELAQNLAIGQETAVIKAEGKEQSYKIRSQARSKMAAVPVGVTAVFLLDETNQIADVGFSNIKAVKDAERNTERKSPIKGAHKQVDGTVATPLESNRITIRTGAGAEKPYEVREVIQSKMAGLRKGDAVILLVDTDNKVIDVAIPPATR